ncbi:MAG: hypothetical protein JNN07_28315 [Verrucomicrobiales bacterium]|nr:hypothetical protein [Verrucomicrobiales bacterium]
MKKQHIKYIIAGLIMSVSLTIQPLAVAAEKEDSKNKTTSTEVEGGKPDTDRSAEGRKLPFHGKLGSFDMKEKTITVVYSTGEKVFHVTPDTEIRKYDKTATLDEAVVGEQVSGAYIKQGDRSALTKLTLAKHAEPKPEGGRKGSRVAKEKDKDKDKAK